MKLIVERDAFAEALGTAKHSTAKTPNIPILKNALLTVVGSKLFIATTNMDMRIELSVPCDVEEDDGVNAITCPVSLLSDLAARFPKGAQLALKWNAQASNVTVSAGRASYKLNALNADMFPVLVDPENPVCFTLPGATLALALNRVRWTTSDDQTRFHICGVCVHVGSNANEVFGGSKERRLIFVATDSYQFARTSIDLPASLREMPSIILPNAALPEIARLASECAGDVEISVSEKLFLMQTDRASFKTKLIDAKYPDYERFVPSDTNSMLVDSEAMCAALLRLKSLGADNRTRAAIAADSITLSISDNKVGQAEEIVSVEYEGEPVTRIISANGFLSVLDHMDADVAQIKFAGMALPISINPAIGTEIDYSRTYFTMPMEGKESA